MPLLTAVPEKCLSDWRTFTGNVGTTLLCERQVAEAWWRDIARRVPRIRAHSTPSAAIYRPSHSTA
ncbi:DUF2478 domain-containing protein [Bradyrhizobium sp. TZ2]